MPKRFPVQKERGVSKERFLETAPRGEDYERFFADLQDSPEKRPAMGKSGGLPRLNQHLGGF